MDLAPAPEAVSVRGGCCHHCGEALPAAGACVLALDGQPRAFCCQGCAAAAEWIAQAELDGYYRLRSAVACRVGDDLPDLAVWDQADVQAEHSRAVERGREVTLRTVVLRLPA